MADRNRDDDDDEDRPRKKKPRPSEEIQDEGRPLKKRRPADDEDEDDEDDRPRRRSIRRSSPDDGGVGIVIPYRNGMALAAYYCAIFGLIPAVVGIFCFGVPALFGVIPVVLGILGLKKAKRDPEAHGTVHAWVGIILGGLEATIVPCGWVGVLIYTALQKR